MFVSLPSTPNTTDKRLFSAQTSSSHAGELMAKTCASGPWDRKPTGIIDRELHFHCLAIR